MNLNKLFLTNNDCYKAGKTITVKGIMVHSTGANNPWLKRYLPDDGKIGKNQYGNHWNTARPGGVQVCVHGFIGKLADGSVATYQTLPWNHRGWHAGGNANNTHIGFEICEDGLSDSTYFNAVYKEATELCAYLCKQYGLTEKDIIDHSEGYKKGIASNHGDVKHWFTKHGKSMDTFRADVKKLLNNSAVEEEDDIQDCKDGKIDMVITKSISRFARNTLDCLKYIRELKEKGVAVFFEKENINTLEAKGEVLITMGDALLQKTYTVDFLSKKRIKNNGIMPQYYVEGSHEAIIPKDIFMRVQEEILRRANLAGDGHKKRVYSGKYAMSGIVYCGHCGDVYRRVHWNNRGSKSVVWRCVTRLEDSVKGCMAQTINEEVLQKAVVDAINSTLGEKGSFLKVLKDNIATVISQSENLEITKIDNQLKELQKQLISLVGTTAGYDEIAGEILKLKEEKDNVLMSQAEKEGLKKRMEDMTGFLGTCTEELTEYDEKLTRQLIERITVFDEKFVITFKSGIEVEIKNM